VQGNLLFWTGELAVEENVILHAGCGKRNAKRTKRTDGKSKRGVGTAAGEITSAKDGALRTGERGQGGIRAEKVKSKAACWLR
jgi:hypothetical protein